MNQTLIVLALLFIIGSSASSRDRGAIEQDRPAPRRSNIYKLEELAWPQIDALDRQRTMFILPVGMIEEHGPHLPGSPDLDHSWTTAICGIHPSGTPPAVAAGQIARVVERAIATRHTGVAVPKFGE